MNSEHLFSEIRALVSELSRQVPPAGKPADREEIGEAMRLATLLHEKLSVLKHLTGAEKPAADTSDGEETLQPPQPVTENVAAKVATPAGELPVEKPEKHTSVQHATLDLFGESEKVLADTYAQGKRSSLAEQMAGAPQSSSLGTRLQKKAVTDLKAAIGINERFQFINELFGGDMHEYSESITRLNSFPGLTEAKEYLEKLRSKFEWDGKPGASELMELVERRY